MGPSAKNNMAKDSNISYLSIKRGEGNNLFEKLLLYSAITLLFKSDYTD